VISVLCGGVGAARFLRALRLAADPHDTTAIINTGDDCVLHGLSISPDIDTITYTLAGAIDPDRGWGLRDESFRTMSSLRRYENTRPAGSLAGATWFGLGDQDLATHLYRTARLAEGANLTQVTAEVAAAWDVPERLLPMSDEPVRTMLTLTEAADSAVVSFQEYFVKLRHDVAVGSVAFDGAEQAMPTADVMDAIANAEVVLIAPSNPLVSLGPIRALPGVDAALAARRQSVVAISPIVGGAALKGPAARMLTELGLEPSVVGVATLYAPIARALVIDPADADLAEAVAAVGIEPVVCPSIMSSDDASRQLATATLAAAR
jgi:LPPG:FO 2-phospho-L-lactate transferase